jgi:hypothetical protein
MGIDGKGILIRIFKWILSTEKTLNLSTTFLVKKKFFLRPYSLVITKCSGHILFRLYRVRFSVRIERDIKLTYILAMQKNSLC